MIMRIKTQMKRTNHPSLYLNVMIPQPQHWNLSEMSIFIKMLTLFLSLNKVTQLTTLNQLHLPLMVKSLYSNKEPKLISLMWKQVLWSKRLLLLKNFRTANYGLTTSTILSIVSKKQMVLRWMSSLSLTLRRAVLDQVLLSSTYKRDFNNSELKSLVKKLKRMKKLKTWVSWILFKELWKMCLLLTWLNIVNSHINHNSMVNRLRNT
jgi:hypothetical protein